VDVLVDTIKDIDLVLIMSVNPGFGGQKFIEQTYEKIRKLKAIIDDAGASTIIEVDGGVNTNNAGALIDAGAKALVAGSFVFKSEDPIQTITDLKNS
jgi:ribulose-phosphate 3-epimerase